MGSYSAGMTCSSPHEVSPASMRWIPACLVATHWRTMYEVSIPKLHVKPISQWPCKIAQGRSSSDLYPPKLTFIINYHILTWQACHRRDSFLPCMRSDSEGSLPRDEGCSRNTPRMAGMSSNTGWLYWWSRCSPSCKDPQGQGRSWAAMVS